MTSNTLPKIEGVICVADQYRPPIYRIRANRTDDGVFELDDSLVRSVVLDGLYTQIPGLKKERLDIEYRRKGRNIELLLNDPFFVKEFPGLPFHVLTFKGAGARSKINPRCVIDPLNWPSKYVIKHKRIWGGLDEGFAVGEAENEILSSRNIFHTPYVAQNKIPEIIQREIYKQSGREKRSSDANLYQIVRLSMTNIRHSDFNTFNDEKVKDIAEQFLNVGWTLERWIEHLGKFDGKLTKECLKLAEKGKFLDFRPKSEFSDNTYITGEITDLEQVVIGKFDECKEHHIWPVEVMFQSRSLISKISHALGEYSNSVPKHYFEKVSETSGYEFPCGSESSIKVSLAEMYRVHLNSQRQKFRSRKVHA